MLTPAEHRIRPTCPVFTKCGGCSLLHLKYGEQLKIKSQNVENCLKKIANIDFTVNKTVKSAFELGYRNKVQLPVRQVGDQKLVGFFAENSHRIIPVDSCAIQNDVCSKIINITKRFVNDCNVSCYDEHTNSGLLKHVVCRTVGDKALVVAVVNGYELPCAQTFIEYLSKEIGEFSLILNINTMQNNVILGNEFKVLYGEGVYYGYEYGIKYPVNAESFIQVNDSVRVKLYSDVVKLLSTDENSVVIDAYSGAGMMSAMIAKHSSKVIGIEVVKEAVDASNELAKINDLSDKIENYNGLCEEILPTVCNNLEKEEKDFSIVLDPPRKGCHINVLNSILKVKPKKVVYVSCSPQTLARDLGILLGTLGYDEKGELKRTQSNNGIYQIESITPYDMFPQTKHVETVVSLKIKE